MGDRCSGRYGRGRHPGLTGPGSARSAPQLPTSIATPTAEPMSSFSTYLIGFVILILGVAIGAYLLNVPTIWIVVGVIILIGLGVLTATSRTKMKDPPAGP
jgi:hypothetical protein